jgi:hypothetical protein
VTSEFALIAPTAVVAGEPAPQSAESSTAAATAGSEFKSWLEAAIGDVPPARRSGRGHDRDDQSIADVPFLVPMQLPPFITRSAPVLPDGDTASSNESDGVEALNVATEDADLRFVAATAEANTAGTPPLAFVEAAAATNDVAEATPTPAPDRVVNLVRGDEDEPTAADDFDQMKIPAGEFQAERARTSIPGLNAEPQRPAISPGHPDAAPPVGEALKHAEAHAPSRLERPLEAALDQLMAARPSDDVGLPSPSAAVVTAPAANDGEMPRANADSRRSQVVSRLLEFAPENIAPDAVTAAPPSESTGSNVDDHMPRGTSSPARTAAPHVIDVGEFSARLEAHGLHPAADVSSREPQSSASPPPAVLADLVQAMRMQVREGGGDAVLRLNPEQFGAVSISLRVENGAVTATIAADVDAVGEWLESQESTLRQGLEEVGLRLERFVIQRDPEERQERREHQPRPRTPRRRPDGNATFELTV